MSKPTTLSPKLPQLIYGGDYNPEQWPEEVWLEDVRLMREAGVNLVSLPVFGWAKLEPKPGQYDLDWLERIMDLLYQHGVYTNLATATASPPPWMAHLYPDTLPVTEDNVRLEVGSRQQYCPSSPVYREMAAALVERLALRFKDHPGLAMWHIGNEYGCHVAACYSEVSAKAFRDWLEVRYSTLERLNEAWGTNFWSQAYGEWAEIQPPRSTPTFGNPSQRLDWQRFSSDAPLECFLIEREIIKRITPDVPVTTNFMSSFKPLDYWKWASHEDLVSNDDYPDPSSANSPQSAAMHADMMRSFKRGKPWLMMEQMPSHVQWRDQNALRAPGVTRLHCLQAVARGAEGAMFFQWRASKGGAEKFHSGMLPHGGEDTRVFRDIKRIGNELKQLSPIIGSTVQADVALLLDYESWWALEMTARPSQSLRFIEQLSRQYKALYERNLTVDFAHPEHDLSGYKLVIAPNLYLVGERAAQNLNGYVEAGGTLLMNFFSGIVDECEQAYLGGHPAPFRKMLGLKIEEWDALQPNAPLSVRLEDGVHSRATIWSDAIILEGASAIGWFEDGFSAHQPAITAHRYGKGTGFYAATSLDANGTAWLLAKACTAAGISTPIYRQAGVELVTRSSGEQRFLFVLNHNAHAVNIEIETGMRDLLSGARVEEGGLQLEARGVAILERVTATEPVHV